MTKITITQEEFTDMLAPKPDKLSPENATNKPKKKCGGKKCKKPECNNAQTFDQPREGRPNVHPYYDRELRLKCLELALKAGKDPELDRTKRYWHWVQTGN